MLLGSSTHGLHELGHGGTVHLPVHALHGGWSPLGQRDTAPEGALAGGSIHIDAPRLGWSSSLQRVSAIVSLNGLSKQAVGSALRAGLS